MLPEDYDWQNPKVYERWLFTADKVEREPELLRICLENISRWEKRNGPDIWHVRWRELVERALGTPEGIQELLALLRDDGERARQWKSAAPFAGVLTKEERRRYTCGWTH